MRVKYTYPVFIKQANDDYLVYVPFWDIYTEGCSFGDAVEMARDAIRTLAKSMMENGEEIPKQPTQKEAKQRAKEDADEMFDYSDGTMVFVDFELKTK